MNTTTWGTFTREAELREVLRHHLAAQGLVDEWSLELQHLPSGFTDNVFLVTITGENSSPMRLILKEYTKQWHEKEAKLYKEILDQNPTLAAPKVLLTHGNWLLLEYLPPNEFRPATGKDLPLLTDWIIAKHQLFMGTLPYRYAEPLDIQRHYLIDKPLKSLSQAQDGPYGHKATKILSTSSELPEILARHNRLPQTLEHGDLEMQNILVSRHGKAQLRLFDWVNARRSTGLFDINQLLENYSLYQPDTDKKKIIDHLKEKLEIPELPRLLRENRQLMILNKLHFYLTKLSEGHRRSTYKGQPIDNHIHSLLSEYIAIMEERDAQTQIST